jgi:phospholipid N-methyltransferase
MRRLLVTGSIVPSSPILVTLMKEALRSSETSVLTRATRRNIPEDTILHSHCNENLKSYKEATHFSGTLVTNHHITQWHNPEEYNMNIHCHGNQKLKELVYVPTIFNNIPHN